MRFLIALTLLAMAAAPGFAKRRNPPPPDPRFAAIGRIVILPVVDARPDPKVKFDPQNIRKTMLKGLKRSNYDVTTAEDTGVGAIALADLNRHTSDWTGRLGPAEARWVMVLCLKSLVNTFNPTAEVMGFLFDKRSGTVYWADTVGGTYQTAKPTPGCQYYPNGCLQDAAAGAVTDLFFRTALRGSIRKDAVMQGVFHLEADFPKMPKTKTRSKSQ